MSDNGASEATAAVVAAGPASSGGNWLTELLRAWGPPIAAVLIIRAFIFEPFRIPSGSMVPTLQIGDFVAVTKFSYGLWTPWPLPRYELLDLGNPQRGDIIVFKYPRDESQNYIKRVVAVAGDHISVRNNQVTVNGERQPWVPAPDAYAFTNKDCGVSVTQRNEETINGVVHDVLVNRGTMGMLRDFPDTEIPAESVFVMGDNRDNSEDSRVWGFVKYSQIKGKAQSVLLSWDHCENTVRTDRIFKRLH